MNKKRSFNDEMLSSRNAKVKVDKETGKVVMTYKYRLSDIGEVKTDRHIMRKSAKDDNMVCLTTWEERKWRK